MTSTVVLYGGCAALYGILAALVAFQARLGRMALGLVAACLVTACWAVSIAASVVAGSNPFTGLPGVLDLLRSACWYVFLLQLYRLAVPGRALRHTFVVTGLVVALVVVLSLAVSPAGAEAATSLFSLGTGARIGLAVCNILLIENLYLNAPEEARWHVNLPCVALGGLFAYDIVLSADAALFRHVSTALFDGRAVASALVVPLLGLAAVRNRAWSIAIHVSRNAVFHSATLVGSGIFLIGLAAAGEAFRFLGADWGGVAEVSLIFAGLVVVAVVLTSRSARSRIRAIVVDNFYSHRFDYRREWMRCITTLSSTGQQAGPGQQAGAGQEAGPLAFVALHTRVIRAVAEIVDAPAGVLFLRDDRADPGGAGLSGGFDWAGSYNMPAVASGLAADHPLVAGMRGGSWIVVLAEGVGLAGADVPPDSVPAELRQAWLAVPLRHGQAMIGFIVVARPRAAFKLDREVFDLLRIIGVQVATTVAQQRATEVLLQARALHDYSKRFAFVAHDIKNVSSQLSLLLSNAEVHLANPEFQRDMLATVRASVAKIAALLKRLQGPQIEVARSMIRPVDRLEALAESVGRLRRRGVVLDVEDRSAAVAMPAAAFDAAVTHLLTNAIEAMEGAEAADGARPVGEVVIRARSEGRRLAIDIVDTGPGMDPAFVREQLFRPFETSKLGGSGIGAFQARELLRETGGDLLVTSAPGRGTTMRLLLPLADGAALVP